MGLLQGFSINVFIYWFLMFLDAIGFIQRIWEAIGITIVVPLLISKASHGSRWIISSSHQVYLPVMINVEDVIPCFFLTLFSCNIIGDLLNHGINKIVFFVSSSLSISIPLGLISWTVSTSLYVFFSSDSSWALVSITSPVSSFRASAFHHLSFLVPTTNARRATSC